MGFTLPLLYPCWISLWISSSLFCHLNSPSISELRMITSYHSSFSFAFQCFIGSKIYSSCYRSITAKIVLSLFRIWTLEILITTLRCSVRLAFRIALSQRNFCSRMKPKYYFNSPQLYRYKDKTIAINANLSFLCFLIFSCFL